MTATRTMLAALWVVFVACSSEKAEQLQKVESELEALASAVDAYDGEYGPAESEDDRNPGDTSREWLAVKTWIATFSAVRSGTIDEQISTQITQRWRYDESSRGGMLLEPSEDFDPLPGDPFQSWDGVSEEIGVSINTTLWPNPDDQSTREEVKGTDLAVKTWARLYIDVELGEYALTFDPGSILVERRVWFKGKEDPPQCMADGDCAETPSGGVVDEQLPAECCVLQGQRTMEDGVVFTWEIRPKR